MDNKEVEGFIEEWCNLYPEDAEFNGNTLRAKPKDVLNKMQKFCKANPNYTKDIIFAATKLYLTEQKQRNWEYTKMATYFISKMGEPSVLENYCNKIIQNNNRTIVDIPEYSPINDFI